MVVSHMLIVQFYVDLFLVKVVISNTFTIINWKASVIQAVSNKRLQTNPEKCEAKV